MDCLPGSRVERPSSRNVAPGRDVEQIPHVPKFRHVVGDDQEQRRQGRHGHPSQQGRRREQDAQNQKAVKRRRQGRPGPASDVGGRPGDGSRGRNAAEEWPQQVADAQGRELRVGIVPGAGHAVGDHRR